jgi:translation elongation factor EF-Tu-like GTPase
VANSEIKVFRRINGLDFAILVVLLTAFLGFGLARAGHAGVNKIIQGTSKVAIDVYIIGLKTVDTDLFKVGDKSAFTIRNQPVYPPMTITAVKEWPKSIAFLPPGAKQAVAMPDPSQLFAHDFLVTVSDQADITADGYVIRGNKIKVGNQVELEGFKYRVQGVVVDIRSIQ